MNQAGTQERGLAVVAGVVSAVATLALCGGAGFLFGQRRVERAKRGWNLVPVVTASRDLPAGAVVKPGDLVEGTAPEQFFTPQIRVTVTGLEGRTLLAPIASGELLHFGHVLPVSPITRACLERTSATATSLGLEGDVSVKALLSDLQTRSGW